MSLLTKEQQQVLEKIRSARASGGCDFEEHEDIEGTEDFDRLFAIFDDLQARAQKQYPEQELRESFEQSHLARVIGVFDRFEENGMYKNPMIQARFDGWKSCARHVGALKAEP